MTYNRDKAIAYLNAQVGKKYAAVNQKAHPPVLAMGPDAFDCSGLTLMAARAGGFELPHQSGAQVEATNAVPYSTANRAKLLPGDLVFYYGDIRVPSSVTHVAMYTHHVLTGAYMVIAAVDTYYGVKKHRMQWALRPSGFGFIGHA